ncbi:sulfite exporter TauE/SafE family protein [Plastorhodobacter daqingensis]|uniref:Probable membrane transporter protein n=1 Tax=Plastorhodobacter daqingensis TaxID=1387281 RepID=A0ABW2UMQ1_9RHOB
MCEGPVVSGRIEGFVQFDWVFFAVAVPAVVFAGVSKGGFASGAAFAATPILALVLSPGEALGLMLPLLMLMDVATLRPYWRKWHGPSTRMLILGAVPGVGLGALVYKATDPDLFRLLIGVIAVGFVVWQFSRRMGWLVITPRPIGRGAGLLAGATAGFTSFVSHAGGPPAAIYLLAQGVGKTAFQATTVIVFWIVNMLKFIPFLFLGIFTADTVLGVLLLAPFAFLGAWLGVRAHHLVPEKAFFGLTYVLLAVTGSKLIWDALA